MNQNRTFDDSALESAVAAALPGAVALLATREGTTYSRAFGLADAAAGAVMREDTVFQIASMTKAVVTAGAMQLVERGLLALDAPIGTVLPELAAAQVLSGFDAAGQPLLRGPARPVTLRHLLTHTAGHGYFFVHPEVMRCHQAAGSPAPGSRAAIRQPLLFDPGERWEYGVGIDWAGLAIEAVSGQRLGAYLEENLFGPLGMTATGFRDTLPEGAAQVHVRTPGGFATMPMFLGGGEFEAGGAGLCSTAPDYARFVRMVLRGGELDGRRVLKTGTIAEMSRNQIGALRAGFMGSVMPELSLPFDPFPDQRSGWGLGWLINPQTGPSGRSPGSLSWAGVFNCYYWVDPAAGIAGVFMAQLAPFGDAGALTAYAALERLAYS